MTLAPAPESWAWAVTLDCKATPVLAPESRALEVTLGRKAILGLVSGWRVPADRRAIQDIRRVLDLAAVDLPVLAAVDRRPARAALVAYRSS